jgi:ankyrin repeat protein
LIYAALQNDVVMVRLLFEMGKVDTEARDYKRRTPLMVAAASHEAEHIVRLLLEMGKADVEGED